MKQGSNDRAMNSTEVNAEVSFMKIGSKDLTIEGVLFVPGLLEFSRMEVFFRVTEDRIIPCKAYRIRLRDKVVDEKTVISAIGFVGTVADYVQYPALKISFCLKTNIEIDNIPIVTGRFFPVSSIFKHFYAYENGYVFSITDDSICITQAGLMEHVKREILFLIELLCSNKRYSVKAIAARCFYHVARAVKRKEIWLISDRINKADDNGEALFKYLNEKKVPENMFFIIREDSADFEDIKKYGKIIAYNSLKHLLLYMVADAVISSDGNEYVYNPFGKHSVYFSDILYKQKHVFLQHGVVHNNLNQWLNKYNKNFSMIVTTTVPEYKAFLTQEYYYDKNVIKLTGLARYDRLFDKKKKILTIMPTWRSNLIDSSKSNGYRIDGKYRYDPDNFTKTEYFQFYNSLLNDERLLEKAKVYGFTIQFMPHPNIIPYIDWFRKNERVRFCSVATKYRQVFAESALVVTDYSSVAFDFAYLRKPVLYCQFDKAAFFTKHIFSEGYFDYERDGFGEVTYNLKDTVERIIEYMENDCTLKDLYRNRINSFFAFHDKNNCQRIYEAIKSLG